MTTVVSSLPLLMVLGGLCFSLAVTALVDLLQTLVLCVHEREPRQAVRSYGVNVLVVCCAAIVSRKSCQGPFSQRYAYLQMCSYECVDFSLPTAEPRMGERPRGLLQLV